MENICSKKISSMAVIVLLINLLLGGVVSARDSDVETDIYSSGHVYLHQKDTGRWEIVRDGVQKTIAHKLSDKKITLNYILGHFFVGINAKCQKDEDLKDRYYKYHNCGIGGQIGIFF